MNKIRVQTFHIDTIKADSPQHQAFKLFQKISFPNFPTIIAIRINQKNPDIMELLALENLTTLQISHTDTLQFRIQIVYQLLRTIWFLHQKQYHLGKNPMKNLLFLDNQTKKIKIKHYLASPISDFKPQIVKKDKSIAKNGIQLSLQYQQKPILLDIWKWATFTAQTLFTFSLQNYIDKVLISQKREELVPQISMKYEFAFENDLVQILQKCLKVKPTQRPPIREIILVFNKIMAAQSLQITPETIKICQNKYSKQENKMRSQFSIQIAQNLLLTIDLKKKLNEHFQKICMKSVKSYTPLYRATRFDFNTRVFYQQCSKYKKLLFVIDTEDSGIISCYIEPEIDLLEGQGLCGAFIADPECKSFIYSAKNQESYKLLIKQKAFKSVPGYGPMIGDGDIVIGNSTSNNTCNFPKSYQTGKHKKLLPKSPFNIRNYDVYHLSF